MTKATHHGILTKMEVDRMQPIRIYEMPPCKMVVSPVGMFGERALDDFDAWMSVQPQRAG